MAEDTEQATTATEQLLECQPTVFVGLGGTGKEILLRLRRRILQHTWNGERLNALSEFPVAAFLYFDTDTNEAKESDRAAASDPMAIAVRFGTGDTLQKRVDVAHYQRDIRNYPYIQEWLPDGEFSRIDTRDGAGQVRPISRLLFFDNFAEFSKNFQAKAARVLANASQENERQLTKLGLKIKPDLRVVVVASTAGGTGSGALIDVGYALSAMEAPKVEKCNLMLLLPGGYEGANEQIVKANTYAALMELEHVMRNSIDVPYVEQWNAYDKNPHPKSKPYNDVYLLDTANLMRERTANIGDLYDMIADILFEDFGSSEFAQHKRSVAVNQFRHKARGYFPAMPSEFGQPVAYSRSYSSVGQCTVATKGRIQLDTAIAEASLGMVEAFFGIARSGPKNVPNTESRDEFLQKHLKLGVSAFEEYPEDLPNRPSAISEYELVRFLLLRPNKSSVQDALVDQLQSEFRDVTERFADIKDWAREVESLRERRKTDVDGKPGTGDLYGPLGHEVADARQRLLASWRADDGEGSMKALLYALLDDHERGGLDYTIDLVEQVKNRIDDPSNGVVKRLSDAAEEYAKLADFFMNQRYLPSLSRLREAAQSRLFGGRKTAIKIIDQLADDLRMHLILRIRAIACLEACSALREISLFLGQRAGLDDKGRTRWSGLIAEFVAGYETVSSTLDVVRGDVARLYDARDRPQSSMYLIINDRSSPEISVLNEDLLEWAKDAFASYKGSKKLFATLRTPEGKLEVISQLQAIAKRKLAHWEAKIPSVTQALRGLSAPEVEALLSKAISRAMPWVDANFDRFRSEFDSDQFKLFVAVDDAKSFESEFGSKVNPRFGIKKVGYVESGVPGRLVVYCELSGFPLDALAPLRSDWQSKYIKESSKPDGFPLHNHKDVLRFPSPVVPTNEELEGLREDLSLFLRAVVFGVLKRKSGLQANQPYVLEIRLGDKQEVGSERSIRKKRFLDENHRRKVEAKVVAIEEGLSPLQLLAAVVAFRFAADKAYPMRQERLTESVTTRVGGLMHSVAESLVQEFESRFASSRSGNLLPKAPSEIEDSLWARRNDWLEPIKGSLKDVAREDASLDPNDSDEFRAEDKCTIRWEKFSDDALTALLGLKKAPPAPPSANVIDVPAAVSFYVAIDGDSKGPFSGLELSAMATKGELVGTSMVYDAERGDNWVEAATVPALANLFNRRSQPRTPPPPPKTDSGQGKAG